MLGVYVGIYALAHLLAVGGALMPVLMAGSLTSTLASLTAFVGAVAAWHSALGEEREIWKWLTAGVGFWTAAEITWGVAAMVMAGASPSPSLADALWLIGYLPVGIAAIEYLAYRRFRLINFWTAILLVGGVILPLAALAYWIRPLTAELASFRAVGLASRGIFPSLDILAATGGVLCVLARQRSLWEEPGTLIGGALVLWTMANTCNWLMSAWGSLDPFGIAAINFLYGLAYMLVGAGCLRAIALRKSAHLPPTASS